MAESQNKESGHFISEGVICRILLVYVRNQNVIKYLISFYNFRKTPGDILRYRCGICDGIIRMVLCVMAPYSV